MEVFSAASATDDSARVVVHSRSDVLYPSLRYLPPPNTEVWQAAKASTSPGVDGSNPSGSECCQC